MLERFRVNLGVQLKFFRRNRLLLAIGLLFLLLFAISLTFSLVLGSTTGRFEIVHAVFSELNGFALVFLGGLALFSISSHLRNRSVKMVLTKPCPPETWLGSVYASGALVALVVYAATTVLALLMCLVWKIPIPSGLFLLAAQSLLGSLIVLFYLGFLSTVLHPVTAVLLALLLNEGTFYGLRLALLTATRSTGGNPILPFVEKATYLLYMLLPVFQPYAERLQTVGETLRATSADWKILLSVGMYALASAGLFYCLSVLAFRRKNLM